MSTRVLRTVGQAVRFARAVGLPSKRLALVPTMGFLHEGHLSLMREAKRRADETIVSIFVNPIQFGPNEDLTRYPRDLEGDLAKCTAEGVDAVFVPEEGDLYPPGFETFVEVTKLSQGLCGARRPGHFRGVATVVAKLFALFRPDIALFGEKDYQQLQVVKALSNDLNLGVNVVGLPTVREKDGLAMSSRNKYLNADERRRALALYRGLVAGREMAAKGTTAADPILARVREELERNDIREDYVELVDAETLAPVKVILTHQPARLLVAALVGTTRLIDNIAVGGY